MTIAEHLRQEGYQKGIHVGIEQGIEKGVQKGEHEKAIVIAKNMLLKNSDVDFIHEVTGLSLQEIMRLVQSH